MYKNKKIAAIIPARKGSKGISNKNIINLNGYPLIEYSLKEATKVDIIDKLIVSTDSQEVLKISKKYNIFIKNLRPKNLSDDNAVLYDVIKYEINNNNLIDEGYEIIILLQPTSPLRKSYMIREAIIDFVDSNQISAVSVSEADENPIFMRKINTNNELIKIIDTNSTVRRQDLEKIYKVNGMIYINYIKDIIEKNISLNDNKSPIIIPKEFAIDVDTIEDLQLAEKIIQKYKNVLGGAK
jgi:CMP-N-acetylneuraminic acid synthetase